MSDKTQSSGGTSFLGLLLLAFIVLKLCKAITWSWWLVLSPVWFVVLIVIALILVAAFDKKLDA